MRVPLQVVVLIIAAVVAAVQRATRSTTKISTLVQRETIFVCLVGTKLDALKSLAAHARGAAMHPHALRFGIVVVVDDSAKVREEWDENEDADARGTTSVAWRYSATPRYALSNAQRDAMRRLRRDENFVLLLHDARCAVGWDDACVRACEWDDAAVITSRPTKSERAAFATLHVSEDDVRVVPRDMAVASRHGRVRDCVVSRKFAFATSVAFDACGEDAAFADGQLRRTTAMYDRGVLAYATLIPIVEYHGVRNGVGSKASTVDLTHAAFGDAPNVGIVDAENTGELIDKYGSVDAAHVVMRVE